MNNNEVSSSNNMIEELEALRLADKRLYSIMLVVFIFLFIVGAITGFVLGSINGALIGLAVCVPIVAIAIVMVGKRKRPKFETEFKRLVVTQELQNVFEDVDYKWLSSVDEQMLRELNIFQSFDIMRGEDYLSATHKGRKFFRSDVSLYVLEDRRVTNTDSDGNTQTDTVQEEVQVFSGSFTCIEREKPYPTKLLFFTEGFPHIKGITGRSKLAQFFGRESNELVTESMEFNRDYEVACTDQIGGRIILSPRRIHGLQRLDEIISDHFAVLFEGNKLYIIVRRDDSFDGCVFGNTTVAEQQGEIAYQASTLRHRIDLLLELEE